MEGLCFPKGTSMKPLPNPKHHLSRALMGLFAPIILFPFAISSFAQLPVIRFVRDPDPAPEIRLKDFMGKELTLESSRGKVVLLNFWATWCGPCREEIPELVALQNRYKDRLQIIGLLVDDDDEKGIRKVIDSEGINYPVALADSDTRFSYGGVAALPTVFVINSEGRVVRKHLGLVHPPLYETEGRALLGLSLAPKVETLPNPRHNSPKNPTL